MLRPVALAALLACASCLAGRSNSESVTNNGAVTPASVSSGTSAVGSVDHLPEAKACLQNAPPPRAVRRLTRSELNNTLADLFGDASAPRADGLFASDPIRYGFANVQQVLEVQNASAFQLTLFAEKLGAWAASHAATLSPGCQTLDATCLGALVDALAPRAYRRPLSAEERAELLAFVSTEADFAGAVGSLVAALVQSPSFLYRTELGVADGNGHFRLTPHETASLLSYTFTASMPDAELLTAAANGNLTTPAQLRVQAQRLLATPRARAAAEEFFAQWLQTAELTRTTRSEGTLVLSDAVKLEMQAETRAFVDDVTFDTPGKVGELFSRDKATLGATLAAFYGAPAAGTVTASSLGRTPGVLGQGAVLAVSAQPTYASPTLRGRMLRMRMLCGSVPSPPAGVPALAASGANLTMRQRLTAHAQSASCATCHVQLDPLGFALGQFDTVGRLRPEGRENGTLVDASGAVAPNFGIDGDPVTVQGAAGLAAYLAQAPEAQDCLVRHWTMYAYGRLSWSQDGCTFAAAATSTRVAGSGVRDALLSVVDTPGFLLRVAAE